MAGARSVLAVMLIACALPALCAPSIGGTAKVVDGDSLEIGRQRIRLWGIDAPEFKQTCARGKQRWACGYAATAALREHLDGTTVQCVKVDVDRYGRMVARCSTRQRSINEWMVREGWATDYARYSKGAYAREQSQAKAAHRGIWSGDFEVPEHYRHRPH